ncbi:MAG TPA: hypothetical protein VFP61_04720 [Acidimicrobiales bacterium]|nr:hypothetical protein [Acidimicrobiales bacterium]
MEVTIGEPASVDGLKVTFDGGGLVANAGLIVVATLASHLGIETLEDAMVRLGDRPGAHRSGRKLLTPLHAMVARTSHIGHIDMLRAGATGTVVDHRVMALSSVTARARTGDGAAAFPKA